uniref:Uncharacterized protein n=1 Tax=Fagus sylvatica TaxID=28930 RepID=A0A2N9IY84_FAGSY
MMWRSKDHRSAGLWWSLLSSGGGHGSLGCDFFVSVGAAVDQSPLHHLPRHLLHHPSQLAPPQTVLVAGFGCEPLGNLRWTTRWRGGPVPSSLSGLPWTTFSGTTLLTLWTEVCGVMGWTCVYKSKWAGPLSVDLIFGSGGWPFLGHFSSCAVYRGSLVLLGFGSWWTTEVWDLIHGGPRTNGPLQKA